MVVPDVLVPALNTLLLWLLRCSNQQPPETTGWWFNSKFPTVPVKDVRRKKNAVVSTVEQTQSLSLIFYRWIFPPQKQRFEVFSWRLVGLYNSLNGTFILAPPQPPPPPSTPPGPPPLTSFGSKIQRLLGRVGPLQRGVVAFSHSTGQRHGATYGHGLVGGHRLQGVVVYVGETGTGEIRGERERKDISEML